MSEGGRGRRLHASLLQSGPRIIPDLIGAEPIQICAWEPWMQHAGCLDVDPELFYPETGHYDVSRAARRICKTCPVRVDCLSYAKSHHEEYGIWGGLTSTERQRVVS